MTDLNSVVLVGRVTKDCNSENGSFGYLQNGTCLAKISIAVNRAKKDVSGQWQDEASFFNVTIFGKLAENVAPRLKKGVQIAVAGSLKQDRWQKDGQTFSSVGVIADSVQVFAPKIQNEQNNANNNQQTYQQNIQQQNYQQNQMQQPNFQTMKPVNNQNIGEKFPEDIPYNNGTFDDDSIPF